jgi:hypothetical protein
MKALMFLLLSTAALAAQDQPLPPAPEPPQLNGPRQPWQDEHWDQVFRDGPFPQLVQNTSCYRLPGGRVVCNTSRGTNSAGQ